MSIFQSDLNTHIINIKCKHADLASSLSTSLSLGARNACCLNDQSVIVTRLQRLLQCYTAFTSEVKYAYCFGIAKSDDTTSVTIDIDIDGVITSFTGTGSAIAIAAALKNTYNSTITSPDYFAEVDGATLYVYSYDSGADSSDPTTVTVTDAFNVTTVSSTNIIDDTDIILNIWNCISGDDLCNIINLTYKNLP